MAIHSGSSVFYHDINTWHVTGRVERPGHPDGDLYHLERFIWGQKVEAEATEKRLDEDNHNNHNWHYSQDGKPRGGH